MWPCTSRSPLGHGCKDCEIVVIPCRRSDGPNPPHWPQEFHHKNDALNVDDTKMLQKCFTIFWLPVSIQSRYAFHGTQICVCVHIYIYTYVHKQMHSTTYEIKYLIQITTREVYKLDVPHLYQFWVPSCVTSRGWTALCCAAVKNGSW